MKSLRYLLLLSMLACAGSAWAQADSAAKPTSGLGHGIRFALDDGAYRFAISGFVQPAYSFVKPDGDKAQQFFRSRRTYLNFSADALKEKVSLFVQADFSANTPLLDAYATYHITPRWGISVGQRRTFTNNREMTFNEDRLQFTDRGFVSKAFCGNGREFGAFLEGRIGSGFILAPQLAVTSGDGPNSFGTNGTDMDLGGLKYGGRLDIYPLGDFSEGNRGFAADLKHESTPKLLLGAAASLNVGASSSKGEGHGDFLFYDKAKAQHLPNLRKISADLLFKYRGFSLLGEYTQASAAMLQGTYLDSSASPAQLLRPGQISEYLVLGSGYNAQLGYVFRSGFALDARIEHLQPEFTSEALSQLQKTDVATLGTTYYFRENNLKLQASVSQFRYQNAVKAVQGDLVLQVVF